MDKVERPHLRLAELLGFGPRQPPSMPRGATRTSRKTIALCHSLLSERGEVSGSRLAAEALDSYQALDDRARRSFFESLVQVKSLAGPTDHAGKVSAAEFKEHPVTSLVSARF